jgi:hypothetical protein
LPDRIALTVMGILHRRGHPCIESGEIAPPEPTAVNAGRPCTIKHLKRSRGRIDLDQRRFTETRLLISVVLFALYQMACGYPAALLEMSWPPRKTPSALYAPSLA